MANYYIGGSGTNPIGAMFRPPKPEPNPLPPLPGRPITQNPSAPAPPGNVLGAQSIRPTGDAKGYDPSYLQNLATAIGGLFSRPQGNLNFNPLGNLSEISPSSGMEGNAPLPGLPSTWLQDALNGLGFSFGAPTPATTPVRPGGGGGGFGGVGRRNLWQ